MGCLIPNHTTDMLMFTMKKTIPPALALIIMGWISYKSYTVTESNWQNDNLFGPAMIYAGCLLLFCGLFVQIFKQPNGVIFARKRKLVFLSVSLFGMITILLFRFSGDYYGGLGVFYGLCLVALGLLCLSVVYIAQVIRGKRTKKSTTK